MSAEGRRILAARVEAQGPCHGRSRQATCPGCASLSRRVDAVSIEIDIAASIRPTTPEHREAPRER